MSEKAPAGPSKKGSSTEKERGEYWNGHEEHFLHTLGEGEGTPKKEPASKPKATTETTYGPRVATEEDIGLKDGKIAVAPKAPAVAKDPSGEKKVLSFLNESLKNPDMLALREAAAASELAYQNQEGGWRYVVRKATFGKVGGKKLEAALIARTQAKEAWTKKLGEQMNAAYKMAEGRAEEVTGSIDAKNAQARKYAKLGLEKTLERYRGRLAHQMVMGEMTTLRDRTNALRQEQWDNSSAFTKAAVNSLAWYNKQPTWKKVAVSSALLTGGAAAVGAAGVGVGAIASYGAWRAARAAFSLTAGRVIGEGAAKGAGVLTGDKRRAVKRQVDIKVSKAEGALKFKNAAKEAVSKYKAERLKLGLAEPTAAEIKAIEDTVRTQQAQELAASHNKKIEDDTKALNKDRRRSNLIKTVVTGGTGIGAFTVAEYLAQGTPSIAETSKGRSGASAMTEPDVPPQAYPGSTPSMDKEAIARAADEMRERQGNTAPHTTGSAPAADIERYGNTSPHATGKAPIFGAPGEQDNVAGVDNAVRQQWVFNGGPQSAPTTPEEVARKAWIEGGMVQDDATGVDARVSNQTAPGEQDNVAGVDNATRQHWNFNGGPKDPLRSGLDQYPADPLADGSAPKPVTPEEFGKVRAPRGINAIVEPQVAKPLFTGLVTVKSGDNLSYIIKEALTRSEHMANLSAAQQDVLVGKYVLHLRALNPAELARMGLPNPSNLDLIQPGNKLDLRLLNEENLYGKFVGEIKAGIQDAPRPRGPVSAPTPVEQAPVAPSVADIQTLSTKIFADQVRDIFSTRAFFFGPRTDGMAEFNRISWQRADTFVGAVNSGDDPTLSGPKAEALRNVLKQAQNGGLNLKNLSIRAALEKASQLEAERILKR